MAKKSAPGMPITIKKYANRRLYNTETSSYITLDTLAAMVRDGREFVVLDAKTGDDITHNILTQIIMEGEGKGDHMLPTGFLRQLISMYGDSVQAALPNYLEASMDAFRANQDKMRSAVEGAFAVTSFADLAKRNMDLFTSAAAAFRPADPAEPSQDEVSKLKDELAALQARLDKLTQ